MIDARTVRERVYQLDGRLSKSEVEEALFALIDDVNSAASILDSAYETNELEALAGRLGFRSLVLDLADEDYLVRMCLPSFIDGCLKRSWDFRSPLKTIDFEISTELLLVDGRLRSVFKLIPPVPRLSRQVPAHARGQLAKLAVLYARENPEKSRATPQTGIRQNDPDFVRFTEEELAALGVEVDAERAAELADRALQVFEQWNSVLFWFAFTVLVQHEIRKDSNDSTRTISTAAIEVSDDPSHTKEPSDTPNDLGRFEASQLELLSSLTAEQREYSFRAFEPFYGAVNALLHSGSLGDYDQKRGDERYAKAMNEWDSVDGPQTLVISANNAILQELLERYAPPESKTAVNAHLASAANLVRELPAADSSRASEIGAAIAEELSESMPETESSPRRRVAEVAGWFKEPAVAAGIGIANGSTVGGFSGVIALGYGATAYESAVWAMVVGTLTFFVVYGYRFLNRDE